MNDLAGNASLVLDETIASAVIRCYQQLFRDLSFAAYFNGVCERDLDNTRFNTVPPSRGAGWPGTDDLDGQPLLNEGDTSHLLAAFDVLARLSLCSSAYLAAARQGRHHLFETATLPSRSTGSESSASTSQYVIRFGDEQRKPLPDAGSLSIADFRINRETWSRGKGLASAAAGGSAQEREGTGVLRLTESGLGATDEPTLERIPGSNIVLMRGVSPDLSSPLYLDVPQAGTVIRSSVSEQGIVSFDLTPCADTIGAGETIHVYLCSWSTLMNELIARMDEAKDNGESTAELASLIAMLDSESH